MSAIAIREGDAPARDEKSGWPRAREHLAQEWASALLIASIVTIANLQFHWLRSFETYTFLVLSNLTSISVATAGKEHRAVIVSIDDREFEWMFQETTPFNREQLARRLRTIYAAEPDLVVVDLDISPAYQPLPRHCPRCSLPLTKGEKDLYELIRNQTTIPTVLLEPFKATGTDLRYWRETWKACMTSGTNTQVRFADGEVPIRYGVHSELSTKPNSVVKVVENLIHPPPNSPGLTRESADARPRKIDPRQLLKGSALVLLGDELSERELRSRIDYELDVSEKINPDHKRVVFFGAAFGGDDLFLTAVGDIYGVEAHAAGYASDEITEGHVVDFILDFVIAILFSLAIAFFWRKYFDARLSDDRTVRELAKLWIIALVSSVLLMVVALSFTSLLLLAAGGIWLSPIPIAVGMLFDSFVSGSVDQATHKFKALRRELIERYSQESVARFDRSVSVSVDPRMQAVTMNETVVESYATNPPPKVRRRTRAPRNHELAYWGARELPRVLGGDICGHLLAHKRGAAALLCLWTVIWASTAVFALYLACTVR